MNTRRIAETIGSYEKPTMSHRALVSRRVTHWSLLSLAALIFAAAAIVPSSQSQTPQTPKAQPKAEPKSQSTKSAQPATPPVPAPVTTSGQLDRDAILHHLNAVITWYRDVTSKVKPFGLPSDAVYQENTRSLAMEAVRLAFQSARAEATIITAMTRAEKPGTAAASTTNSSQPNDGQPAQQQSLAQNAARIAAQIDDTQTKLDAVNKQLATAPR